MYLRRFERVDILEADRLLQPDEIGTLGELECSENHKLLEGKEMLPLLGGLLQLVTAVFEGSSGFDEIRNRPGVESQAALRHHMSRNSPEYTVHGTLLTINPNSAWNMTEVRENSNSPCDDLSRKETELRGGKSVQHGVTSLPAPEAPAVETNSEHTQNREVQRYLSSRRQDVPTRRISRS